METLTQILDSLEKALLLAPFLATIGGFSIAGDIFKRVFTKTKAATPGKYQWFWFNMCRTLPLHPIVAGIFLGLIDPAHGVSYYALAGVISVFLFDSVKRLTGFKVDLPGDSLPPES